MPSDLVKTEFNLMLLSKYVKDLLNKIGITNLENIFEPVIEDADSILLRGYLFVKFMSYNGNRENEQGDRFSVYLSSYGIYHERVDLGNGPMERSKFLLLRVDFERLFGKLETELPSLTSSKDPAPTGGTMLSTYIKDLLNKIGITNLENIFEPVIEDEIQLPSYLFVKFMSYNGTRDDEQGIAFASFLYSCGVKYKRVPLENRTSRWRRFLLLRVDFERLFGSLKTESPSSSSSKDATAIEQSSTFWQEIYKWQQSAVGREFTLKLKQDECKHFFLPKDVLHFLDITQERFSVSQIYCAKCLRIESI